MEQYKIGDFVKLKGKQVVMKVIHIFSKSLPQRINLFGHTNVEKGDILCEWEGVKRLFVMPFHPNELEIVKNPPLEKIVGIVADGEEIAELIKLPTQLNNRPIYQVILESEERKEVETNDNYIFTEKVSQKQWTLFSE